MSSSRPPILPSLPSASLFSEPQATRISQSRAANQNLKNFDVSHVSLAEQFFAPANPALLQTVDEERARQQTRQQQRFKEALRQDKNNNNRESVQSRQIPQPTDGQPVELTNTSYINLSLTVCDVDPERLFASDAASLSPFLEVYAFRTSQASVSDGAWKQMQRPKFTYSHGKLVDSGCITSGSDVFILVASVKQYELAGHVSERQFIYRNIIINSQLLCCNDYDRPILFRLYYPQKDAVPIFLGELRSSLRRMQAAIGIENGPNQRLPVPMKFFAERCADSSASRLKEDKSSSSSSRSLVPVGLEHLAPHALAAKGRAKNTDSGDQYCMATLFIDSATELLHHRKFHRHALPYPAHSFVQIHANAENLISFKQRLNCFIRIYREVSKKKDSKAKRNVGPSFIAKLFRTGENNYFTSDQRSRNLAALINSSSDSIRIDGLDWQIAYESERHQSDESPSFDLFHIFVHDLSPSLDKGARVLVALWNESEEHQSVSLLGRFITKIETIIEASQKRPPEDANSFNPTRASSNLIQFHSLSTRLKQANKRAAHVNKPLGDLEEAAADGDAADEDRPLMKFTLVNEKLPVESRAWLHFDNCALFTPIRQEADKERERNRKERGAANDAEQQLVDSGSARRAPLGPIIAGLKPVQPQSARTAHSGPPSNGHPQPQPHSQSHAHASGQPLPPVLSGLPRVPALAGPPPAKSSRARFASDTTSSSFASGNPFAALSAHTISSYMPPQPPQPISSSDPSLFPADLFLAATSPRASPTAGQRRAHRHRHRHRTALKSDGLPDIGLPEIVPQSNPNSIPAASLSLPSVGHPNLSPSALSHPLADPAAAAVASKRRHRHRHRKHNKSKAEDFEEESNMKY